MCYKACSWTSVGRALSDAELGRAMAHLDSDGNGTICFEEFYEWFKLGLSVAALVGSVGDDDLTA